MSWTLVAVSIAIWLACGCVGLRLACVRFEAQYRRIVTAVEEAEARTGESPTLSVCAVAFLEMRHLFWTGRTPGCLEILGTPTWRQSARKVALVVVGGPVFLVAVSIYVVLFSWLEESQDWLADGAVPDNVEAARGNG